jgi:hypothetical protein
MDMKHRCYKVSSIRLAQRTLFVLMSSEAHCNHGLERFWPSQESTIAFFAQHGIKVDPSELVWDVNRPIKRKVDSMLSHAIPRRYGRSPWTLDALIQQEIAPLDVGV